MRRSAAGGQQRFAKRRVGGRRRSWARSNGDESYLSVCGVHGGASDAPTDEVAKPAHGEAQPEGAREVVSRALQGEAWA